ncbi:hypothetical protein Nepgr_022613 [Nepenthes gracilis]|uniref:Myb-like domain-containing protein n=1 Tax=Nepenthes gracilis TaxID=150966 RepID=A0AAD3T161_NEPGR|nr:hypothetical protein Nepgr_022613 [Nepenthes gracilis]
MLVEGGNSDPEVILNMYISDIKPRPPQAPPSIDFYKDHQIVGGDEDSDVDRDMIIVATSAAAMPSHHQQQMVLGDAGSSGEDQNRVGSLASAPKKRAETWVQEETHCLISFRREMDSLFNTSKSNKHLWDQISIKMREKGFDRSPSMCTDKWRNLFKEFKKAKQQHGGNGSAKMSYYKEIEDILRERNQNASAAVEYKSPSSAASAKIDSFMQFSDKGIDDANIPFGPIEANGRTTLNLERRLDHDGHPLAITAADTVGASGVPPSFWREAPGDGDETHSYGGRVISVKCGDYTRRVGIDGTTEAIKEAIKSAFGIRTKRAIWLEDEDQIVRSLDRDMPIGTYTLHLDDGVAIKVYHYDEANHIPVHTEEKTFYTEDDFREFLNRREEKLLVNEIHVLLLQKMAGRTMCI